MSDENQHWVPKFLIKNFADRGGRVFSYDIHSGEITKPPPKLAASERGFNDFQIAGKMVTFEDQLEKIETAAAPLLKRILQERSLAGLSPTDRERMANFIAVQSFRTKAFYAGFIEKTERNAFATTLSSMMQSLPFSAAEIARRHWAVMVIESGRDTFYLGDNPVVLQRTDDPKNGVGLGFDVRGVEAFLPLSPTCALYMPCQATSKDRLARYDAAMELHRVVRSHALRGLPGGGDELQTAQLVISQLNALYSALKTGAALPARSENVENLNYLQCSWAYTSIYSARRDFAFAQRVFRENPQYRSVPKTSLIQMTPVLRE